ncbi:fructosamine kinase family protein [Leifsonia sp. AK011]|uniref:fructosamine kinase family protein n=1 Tax=Leifsonia sp. AK011 TaxID=2723075 RepID=UPI0015CD1190|nr:fructosamine kinase family protein [Leifsonia sp. AK011]
MEAFTKSRQDAPVGFFEAEAAGLDWLTAAHGARTVAVIDVAPGRIRLEWVPEVPPTRTAARAFGSALARTHAAGARSFGAPPDGWVGPLFIGRRPMASAEDATWGGFYARDRVLPFVALAEEAGTIDDAEARDIRRACERIAAGDFDDDEPPARIHGDLWAGNVLWSHDGVVLIDPAAHGGHRETDLAMLHLFGCPYLDDVIEGYRSDGDLATDYERRIPLHQLHPLAVHAAGHGRHYGRALHDAALVVLEL